MSLKILVLGEDLVQTVLNDCHGSKVISKVSTPVIKYTLDNNIEIKVKKTLTEKSLRGQSFDILYCNHEFYIKFQQYIVGYKSYSGNNLRVIIL